MFFYEYVLVFPFVGVGVGVGVRVRAWLCLCVCMRFFHGKNVLAGGAAASSAATHTRTTDFFFFMVLCYVGQKHVHLAGMIVVAAQRKIPILEYIFFFFLFSQQQSTMGLILKIMELKVLKIYTYISDP